MTESKNKITRKAKEGDLSNHNRQILFSRKNSGDLKSKE